MAENIAEMWRPGAPDITTPAEVAERKRAFAGLAALGKNENEECSICTNAFNSVEGEPGTVVTTANRLFSCGCAGTRNQHVFHEYCLATYCSGRLREQGREGAISGWDKAGVPCPICRGNIGQNGTRVQLIHPGITPNLGGRKSRKRKLKRLRKSRR